MLPLTGTAVVIFINPAGPVHTVVTFTGTSTAGLNITVQVRVISEGAGQIGLAGLLVMLTEVGAGTAENNVHYCYYQQPCMEADQLTLYDNILILNSSEGLRDCSDRDLTRVHQTV